MKSESLSKTAYDQVMAEAYALPGKFRGTEDRLRKLKETNPDAAIFLSEIDRNRYKNNKNPKGPKGYSNMAYSGLREIAKTDPEARAVYEKRLHNSRKLYWKGRQPIRGAWRALGPENTSMVFESENETTANVSRATLESQSQIGNILDQQSQLPGKAHPQRDECEIFLIQCPDSMTSLRTPLTGQLPQSTQRHSFSPPREPYYHPAMFAMSPPPDDYPWTVEEERERQSASRGGSVSCSDSGGGRGRVDGSMSIDPSLTQARSLRSGHLGFSEGLQTSPLSAAILMYYRHWIQSASFNAPVCLFSGA